LATVAAIGLPLGAFRAVDALQTGLRTARPSRGLELGAIRNVVRRRERFQHGLGPLVRGAHRMEPQPHLAFRVGIRQPLAETDRAALERIATAPALGAPARGGLEDVGHRQLRTSAHSAPVTRRSSSGVSGKTVCGVPPAAQIFANWRRSWSSTSFTG